MGTYDADGVISPSGANSIIHQGCINGQVQRVMIEFGGFAGAQCEFVREGSPGRVLVRPVNFATGVLLEVDSCCVRPVLQPTG